MFGKVTEKIKIFIKGEKMNHYQCGLVSVSFRANSPEQILEAMRDAKLSCVEWGSDVHAPYNDRQKLEELVQLQKEYGISCCSYGTYFRLGVTPLEELESYISAAKILGTEILRLWCGDKNSEDYTEKEKEVLFDECKAAAQFAHDQGVTLCMECHNCTFTNTKESALELMLAVNSENFRMYWQPNQCREEEENIAYAKLISSYTERIHVFNWKERERYPLKDAENVWKRYLECIPDCKTLLLEFMPDDRIESLKTEAQSLFSIVKENV